MPPRKRHVTDNPTASNSEHTGPLGNGTPDPNMQNQFQQMMQAMLDQQRRANENQARLQEQMARKDEEHAREMATMQRQLLEMLERRPEPAPAQPLGTQIVINNREHDPNALYEKFRKRGPKEFTRHEDPLAADDWLEHTENIFEIFRCTGRQQVQLTASMFTGLADIWWKTIKAEYRTIADAEAWTSFKRQFGEKYVPTHVKRQKAIEFQQLVQGNTTVQEYLTKFERLSRYALESIDTVEKKIAKFLEGLNPIIERDATGVVPPITFEEAVRRAYKFENLNNKILKIQGKAPAH
ncbi:hypothetical protein AAC387_Pa03g1647 [Persea americana]